MKNISINSFIHIIFSIVFIFLVALFSLYLKLESQIFIHDQENRYMLISNSFLTKFSHHPNQKSLEDLSKKLDLKHITKTDKLLKILNKAKVIFQKEEQSFRIRVFELKNKYFIYIQSMGYNLMYKINIQKNYKHFIALFVFIFTVILILFIYLALLKKLRPLKSLHNNIIRFSNGDLKCKLQNNSKDEIGQISQSFNNAIENINQLINSKNLFMKNILHELKTPITKGLFLAQMIETKPQSQKDKKAIIKTFNTINAIINQLSNIEKLKNTHLNIQKEQIELDNIFNHIKILLELDKNKLHINYLQKPQITANKELFATMIKNLIENGIKYTSSFPVIVNIRKNQIDICSLGEKLPNTLEHYTQAFVQGKKNSKGFGLGLYITQEIANIHNFKLTYNHKENQNIFSIVFK